MSEVVLSAPDASNSAGLNAQEIEALNERYRPLDFEARLHKLYTDFAPEKVMVTSSFAATSAYFLHIISRIRPEQVILFIDTGFVKRSFRCFDCKISRIVRGKRASKSSKWGSRPRQNYSFVCFSSHDIPLNRILIWTILRQP